MTGAGNITTVACFYTIVAVYSRMFTGIHTKIVIYHAQSQVIVCQNIHSHITVTRVHATKYSVSTNACKISVLHEFAWQDFHDF